MKTTKEAKDEIKTYLQEKSEKLIPTCNCYCCKDSPLKQETDRWIGVLKKYNKQNNKIEFIDENGFQEKMFKPVSPSNSKYVWYYASNLGRILAVELEDINNKPDLTRDTINNFNIILLPLEESTTAGIIFRRKNGNEVQLGQMSAYNLVADVWLEKKKEKWETHHIYNDINDNRADNLINLPATIHNKIRKV